MCAGTCAYIFYESKRYHDQVSSTSMSKVGKKSAKPKVSTGRTADNKEEGDEVEMSGKLLTEEEILEHIERVNEKERRNREPQSTSDKEEQESDDDDDSALQSPPRNPLM